MSSAAWRRGAPRNAFVGLGGLLITTEKRIDAEKHVLDVTETVQRLTEARDLLASGAELAQKNKVQDADDQAQVARAVQAQIDEIRGTRPAEPGSFPSSRGDFILVFRLER